MTIWTQGQGPSNLFLHHAMVVSRCGSFPLPCRLHLPKLSFICARASVTYRGYNLCLWAECYARWVLLERIHEQQTFVPLE